MNTSRPVRALAPSVTAARRVLLVQAYDLAVDSGAVAPAVWSAHDRAWATRLTRETTPADAPPTQLLDARASHALQRLLPRQAELTPLLQAGRWRPAWLLLAATIGLALGLGLDSVGSSQHINLLAPPVWGVVLWNLLVCLGLPLWHLLPLPAPGGPRRWLARRLAGTAGPGGEGQPAGTGALPPRQTFVALWAAAVAPLMAARAALVLHVAALALALGLMGSLYVRGLVLDYRAGWQSTFLEAPQVHAVLSTLLAPAVALTGIPVPDALALERLRVVHEVAPTAPAAPWLHLYAAMLALGAVLPRGLLALVAGARARWLAGHLPLPVDELYFQRLLHELRGNAARVWVLPHGAPPTPAALAGLRGLLTQALGDNVQLSAAAAVAYGDEEGAVAAPADTTLGLLLADLGATPEDDTHGRWLQALRQTRPGLPLALLVDEAAFAARFATLPARLAERRLAWQRWAQAQKVPLLLADLGHPAQAATLAAMQAVLMH